jgi:hypothetical protein
MPQPTALKSLLVSEVCSLPKARDRKIPLPDQLRLMHEKYHGALARSSASNPICNRAASKLPLIRRASKHIRESVAQYLNGSPFKAYQELKSALDILRPFLLAVSAPRNRFENLYRIREVDTLEQAERKDIFHVPFEFRHRVATARYSISGWPSLYLGGSLLVCWEELGRPTFSGLSIAAFRTNKSVSILDFGYRPSVLAYLHEPEDHDISFFTPEQMAAYLICWPLIAACSIKAHSRKSAFIEEYIIPQLLLQWIRDDSMGLDGIRYFSTRLSQTPNSERLAVNYVFPVKEHAHSGHCDFLSKKFELTLPYPWVLLDSFEFRDASPASLDEPYFINSETSITYDHSIFRALEHKLDLRPFAGVK